MLDTGHHAPNTNIEFIVMMLLRQGRLGAFDFNSRFYADDDLMVGAADPFQLFRILHEIVSRGAHLPASGVNFMLDQCHNIEPKIQGQIRSVLNVLEATAKALVVDEEALRAAQQSGDVLGANGILMDAFATDVRPLLADLREERGLPRDPDRRVQGVRLPGADRRRAGRRPPGRLGRLTRASRLQGHSIDEERTAVTTPVHELIARSNRLGADPANTNYAGGNTSAKGSAVDPATSRGGRAALGEGLRAVTSGR